MKGKLTMNECTTCHRCHRTPGTVDGSVPGRWYCAQCVAQIHAQEDAISADAMWAQRIEYEAAEDLAREAQDARNDRIWRT